MPANEVQLSLNTQDFEARIARVKKDLAEVIQLASQATLGGNAGTPQAAAIRAGLSSVSTSESSVKSTATNAGPSGPTPASAAAAQWTGTQAQLQQFNQFQRQFPGLGPSAYTSVAQQLGMTQAAAPPPAFGTQMMVASLVASTQMGAVPGAAAVALPAAAGMPPVMNAGGFPNTSAMTLFYQRTATGQATVAQGGYAGSRTAMAIAGPLFMSAQQTFGGAMDLSTRLTMTGGTDEIAKASMVGSGMGAALGIPVGLGTLAITKNPFLAFAAGSAAAALGSTVFGGIMGYYGAEKQQEFNALSLIGGTLSGIPRSQRTYSTFGMSGRIAEMRSDINRDRPEWSHASVEGVAKGWSAIALGLSAGGIDAFGPGGGGIYGMGDLNEADRIRAQTNQWYRSNTGRYRLPGVMAGRAEEAIFRLRGGEGFGPETLAEMYYRRLASIPGLGTKGATEMAPSIAQIMSRLPETGGNVADILAQTNPRLTAVWLSIQSENLRPGVSQRELERIRGAVGSAERRATLGGLQSRGAGAAVYSAIGDEMTAISELPQGRDSLAYANAAARRRDAGREAFEAKTAIEYGIPQSRVEAARGILAAMPYGPGNRMAVELTAMNISGQQIGRLNAYMRERRSRGELTEMEELDINQQIGRLQVSVAQGMGALSEGVLDRIPALSTNAPNGWRRFDSMQMAAINLGGMGSPNRRHGAMGGAQARMQDQFISMFGMGSLNPYSKTEGLNNPAVGEMTAILRQMLELMMRGAQIPGFNRPANSNPLPPNNGTGPQGQQVPF